MSTVPIERSEYFATLGRRSGEVRRYNAATLRTIRQIARADNSAEALLRLAIAVEASSITERTVDDGVVREPALRIAG